MQVVRNVVAVVGGYLIFVFSAIMLFQWAHIDPHADPSVLLGLIVVGYGIAFSFLAGMFVVFLSKTKKLYLNYTLALIMAGIATFSFFKSEGNHYTQLAAIFLFAPASIAGGWFLIKKRAQNDQGKSNS